MDCKQCGAPQVEGAIYCGYCGARVDGKKSCHACGKLNDERFAFCIYCGTRIDGKTVCKSCGTAHDGAFCPDCGTAVKASASTKKKEASSAFGKICGLIGGGLMMLGVLFALVFVFFIGVELDGEKTNLYTFFGEYYKEMDTTGISSSGVTVSKWWKNLLETQTTLYGVFGTVISALTLLSVVGFAAVAAVKYILSWVKKTENTANGWAVASILSFVVGSLLFYAHLRLNVSAVDYADIFSAIGENAEIKFNGATAFGIAFSLACVGLGVIAATLSKGKTLWTGKRAIATACAFAGVFFSGALLAAAQFSAFNVDVFADSSHLQLSSGFGLFNLSADVAFLLVLQGEIDSRAYTEGTAALGQMNFFNVFCMVCVILLAVLAVISLYKNLCSAQGGRSTCLAWSGAALLVSVLFLVFNILAWERFLDIFRALAKYTEGADFSKIDFEGNFAAPICAIVFSSLTLAASVVNTVFRKKQTTLEE